MPTLSTAFQKYLGCRNIIVKGVSRVVDKTDPDDDGVMLTDFRLGICLDAEAASENIKPNIVGAIIRSEGREEDELVKYLLSFLNSWNEKGLLRTQGKAVCWTSSKSLDGMWVYCQEAMEVQDADKITRAVDGGGFVCRIHSAEK